VTLKRYFVFLLVSLTFLGGAARADTPASLSSKEPASLSGIGRQELVVALAVGAGVGVAGALFAGGNLLTVGAGTVAAIYVGHLLLEAIVVGGTIYGWPDSEEAEELARRPLLYSQRTIDNVKTMDNVKLRLVATY